MATRERPPENPDSRAKALSAHLIEGLRARMGDRESNSVSEFLAEGVALGDVEYALYRLGNNLVFWSRLPPEIDGFPCLIDEDGPVPVDLWDLGAIGDGSYRPYYRNYGKLDYRRYEQKFYRTAKFDFLNLSDLLDVVQSRLSRFLQTRVQDKGGSEPTRGGSGNDAGGGSGAGFAAATALIQEEMEDESETGPENESEATAADARIRSAKRAANRKVLRSRSLGGAVAGFTGIPTLYQATIHTAESGLRIHQSPAYFINWSMVFGSPTPSVTGWLLPGRYKFGAMNPSGKFRFDKSNFDIPPLSSFDLVLNK